MSYLFVRPSLILPVIQIEFAHIAMHILHLPCKEEKTVEQWRSFHYILRNVHCMLVWKSSELTTIRKAQSCYEMSFMSVMTSLYVGYECCTQILWNEEVVTSHHIFLMIFSKKTEDFVSWQYVVSSKFDQMKNSSHKNIFLDDFLWWNFLDKFEQVFINKIEEIPNWWSPEIFTLELFFLDDFLQRNLKRKFLDKIEEIPS
jgi:hypothetical protein